MKKYLIEFIGTFFLVSTIGLTGNPLAIGVMLTILVYMGGHISGAHYNPAVTLSILFKKLIKKKEAVNYIIFQLLASFCAAFFVFSLNTELMHVAPNQSFTVFQTILCELLLTFELECLHGQYFEERQIKTYSNVDHEVINFSDWLYLYYNDKHIWPMNNFEKYKIVNNTWTRQKRKSEE